MNFFINDVGEKLKKRRRMDGSFVARSIDHLIKEKKKSETTL